MNKIQVIRWPKFTPQEMLEKFVPWFGLTWVVLTIVAYFIPHEKEVFIWMLLESPFDDVQTKFFVSVFLPAIVYCIRLARETYFYLEISANQLFFRGIYNSKQILVAKNEMINPRFSDNGGNTWGKRGGTFLKFAANGEEYIWAFANQKKETLLPTFQSNGFAIAEE